MSRRAMCRAVACSGFVVLASSSLVAAPQHHAPQPAVDVQAYRFELELADDNDRLHGNTLIRVGLLGAATSAFELDLVGVAPGSEPQPTGMIVRAVSVDGDHADFEHVGDRLRVALPAGPAREVEVGVVYDGIPADGLVISSNAHGERTFFGDNWPDRARHWLPVVDHVADKARVEFVVTAPDHYQVVSNGRLREETDLPGRRRRTHWASEVDLPTKVMVIGVARFAVQHLGTVAGVPLESWVYPQDRAAGFHDYAIAARILTFFVDRVGPFPYAKLANVQSKTRFGGMENAGAIFYSERSVTGSRRSEGLIAHEIAHQWFGDSVTEADWPHVWLSEGFATYFAQLYTETTYGRERLRSAMAGSRERVLAYARAEPEGAVVPEHVESLMGLLNANSYQKGGWVLHMLRRQVGDAAFWTGVRAYYARFRDRNASSDDLRRVMETACGCDLAGFFEQWLYRPGQPEIALDWSWDADSRRLRIAVRQRQSGPPFAFPLDLGIRTGDAMRIERLEVDAAEAILDIASDRRPDAVVLDPDTWLLFRELIAPEA